jgi:hypothetical protein
MTIAVKLTIVGGGFVADSSEAAFDRLGRALARRAAAISHHTDIASAIEIAMQDC